MIHFLSGKAGDKKGKIVVEVEGACTATGKMHA